MVEQVKYTSPFYDYSNYCLGLESIEKHARPFGIPHPPQMKNLKSFPEPSSNLQEPGPACRTAEMKMLLGFIPPSHSVGSQNI